MASHPRTLRARKRAFPGREQSAPAADMDPLQQEEPHGSSVCKLTSNGLKQSSATLSKDVKANDSCAEVNFPSDKVNPLNLACATAQRERGESPSFQAAGGSNVLEQGAEPGNIYDERGQQQEHGDIHFEANTKTSLRGMDCRNKGAKIQEHSSTSPPNTVQCPPGSLQSTCEVWEVGRAPNATDGVTDRDREKEKAPISIQLMERTSDDPSGKPDPGEGWGNGSDPEQLQSLAGGQCEEGPTKKKVRKRMGMWGFGERERRSHCEGQLTGRNQKKGGSEIATEREGKVGREDEEPVFDCCKEVTEERPEMPKCDTVANSRTEGTLDTAWGLAGQLRGLPAVPDLYCPTPSTPLNSIPEEEPPQPIRKGPYTMGEQPFTAGMTIAGETKTSPSITHTEKTAVSEDTSPCGMGEASAEYGTGASSESSGVPCAELGGAACQARREGGRRTGNPCAVQEEDCDLSITVLEEKEQGPGRRGTSGVQRIMLSASSNPGASPVRDPLEAKTADVPCGGVVCAPSEGTPLPDPSLPGATRARVAVDGQWAVVEVGAASCMPRRSGDGSGSAEPLGAERTGQGSSQGCTTPTQGGSATEDAAEPPELEEKPYGETGKSRKMQSSEAASVTETMEAPAAGLTGAASTEELWRTRQHCVTLNVDVHISQPDCRTEAKRPSNMGSSQHPDTGGGVLLNMVVSSHDVQDTGSECGLQGPVCASVSSPVCEDRTLPCDTDLVQNFGDQPFTAQSSKPSGDPDSAPSLGSLSDSQLNNITLSETEENLAPDPTDEQEDASELLCGLIKELSSLNRTVMAAHRELDHLRRGNKALKPPLRRSYGFRRSEI